MVATTFAADTPLVVCGLGRAARDCWQLICGARALAHVDRLLLARYWRRAEILPDGSTARFATAEAGGVPARFKAIYQLS